jgi:tetratricopeptide (TPR) repeat protein
MENIMPKIFIGYRRDDGGHARAIYQYLQLWFDKQDVFLDHENLDSGETFKPALAEAIEASQVFLAVIGQHWYAEKNRARLAEAADITRGELRCALQKGVPIIPILCGGATVPPKAELSTDIAALCHGNAHPLPESEYASGLTRLIDQLRDVYEFQPRYRPPHGVSQACHLGDQKLSAYFSDPVDALGRLRRLLTAEGRAAVVGQATLQGMGGVGKTQLALKYCETFKDQYAGVWWFKAESLVQLQQDYQYFCTINGVAVADGEEPHQAVNRILRQQPRWLLVFDNAEAEYGEKQEHLRRYLPDGEHHLIITARSPELGDDASTIPLDSWTEEQALPFLRQCLAEASDDDLRLLCRTLGGLPLALEQACAYLKKTGSAVAVYCAAVDDLARGKSLLERNAAQANGYDYSVLATLSLAFDRLSESAQQLLRLCTWCAAEPIPDILFRRPAMTLAAAEQGRAGVELSDEQRADLANLLPEGLRKAAANELLWGETVAELTGFALAQRVEVDLAPPGVQEPMIDKALLLHRLTQAVVIHRLGETATDAPALTELVARAYPGDLSATVGWPLARVLAPHVLRLEEHFATGYVPHKPLSWLLDQLAVYLKNGPALYGQAVDIFRRNLERSKELLGADHPDTLTSMNNLAGTLFAMGDHQGVWDFEEQVFARRIELLGADHPDTLTSMGNLAGTLYAMGDLRGARDYQKQVLERSTELLGADHPGTLTSMNNLAQTLKAMGDHKGARDYEEQVLARSTELLGADHPDTLTSMNNLASTLWDMGNHQGARKLEEQVLERSAALLGVDHPSTTGAAWNLFNTLREMGDGVAAQSVLDEHLIRLLDEDVELHSGDQREIRDMLRQALGAGGQGPTASEAMRQAVALMNEENWAGAKALLAPLLRGISEQLDARDPNLTLVAWHLFLCFHNLKEHDAAKEILQKYLLWLVAEDPEALPEKLQGIRQQVLQLTGDDFGSQREALRKALNEKAAELGPDHPDSLLLRHNLGVLAMRQEDWTEAETLHREVLGKRLAVLGERHPDTTNSAWYRFLCLHHLNDSTGAQEVIDTHLRWLLQHNPDELAEVHREVKTQLEAFMQT